MNTYFLDPYKSEEGFRNLYQMKDNHIFRDLLKLLDEQTTYTAFRNIQVSNFPLICLLSLYIYYYFFFEILSNIICSFL